MTASVDNDYIRTVKHLTLLFILISTCSLITTAQNSNEPIYIDSNYQVVSKNLATYVMIKNESDIWIEHKLLVLSDASLHRIDSFKRLKGNLEFDKTLFSSSNYYPNGKLHYKRFYDLNTSYNKNLDSSFSYYKNGQLKRIEYGKKSYGESSCFDKKGKPKEFTPLFQEAQFPKGDRALTRYLESKIRYPKEALEKNIEGTVYVEFDVCTDGALCNFKIIKGNSILLNEEAIRVIKTMPKWTPKQIDDKKVKSRFALPINFRTGY